MFFRAKHTCYLSFSHSSQTCIFSCHTRSLEIITDRVSCFSQQTEMEQTENQWLLWGHQKVEILKCRSIERETAKINLHEQEWEFIAGELSVLGVPTLPLSHLQEPFQIITQIWEKSQTVGVTASERGTFKISTVFSAYPINYTLKEKNLFEVLFCIEGRTASQMW